MVMHAGNIITGNVRDPPFCQLQLLLMVESPGKADVAASRTQSKAWLTAAVNSQSCALNKGPWPGQTNTPELSWAYAPFSEL